MNCKPNDMAVLVRNSTDEPCFSSNIGATVEVLYTGTTRFGPAWKLKKPMRCMGCGVEFKALLDADLQPIRPAPTATAATTDVGLGEFEVLTEPA